MGLKKEKPEQLEFDFGGADLGTREAVQLELPFEERFKAPPKREWNGPSAKLGDNPSVREQLMKAREGLKTK